MHVTPLAWVITIAVLTTVLVVDVIMMKRKPHEPSMKECAIAISIFVGAAILFAIGIGLFAHPTDPTKTSWNYATEFIAGYLTEYSLSIDNLFVFIILLGSMKVPRKYQQFTLMMGIILALIFRGIFIALGAVIINTLAWAFFIFGVFLLYTAWKLVDDYRKPEHEETSQPSDNKLMLWIKNVVPSTEEYHDTHLSLKIDGKRVFTPLFFVIVALGSIDIMFALDSIPAIFGLTQEPYLVFTANFFALMGLRQLYFLLGGLLKRLVYLSLGLSFILAFIGVKLLLHAAHHYDWIGWEVPTWLSLVVIIVTLVVTAVASLMKTRHAPKLEPEHEL
ncbi:TerC/Alx family metal homeostasis membrane protein [Propionimicrobium lymphophilum]|uniref:TerC family integral membrane protein n=1 Tax=Propionimicrobium lymphophilum ACS-093-V-SCH5 TaxID=883161 RepID=S2W0F0_9ACTN|nr:TerC/Alx family metal homeostasis membrane protein [Propionimicrobium lymphophilum]EPD33203.1 TerC family integral membrane protein [Propionimicrobium lymphophilum ACS-093-V-SCH5]MDK7709988.1 TerC/Alx family metal homeostasis membrane protein [Propionimicrobium lymphophilum]MDK7732763.1 TerC/Alx family metal homeostasis membrane protein [Propionimicrobium lymphophilum]